MKVLHSLKNFDPANKGGALCIGNFDGVHIGHQHLLTETVKLAKTVSAPAVVLTFDPHPMCLLDPQKMPEPICTLTDKLNWLDQAGAQIVIVEKTRPEILKLEPRDFLNELILKNLQPKWFIEGQSFRFGLNRTGDINTLKQLGQAGNFQVRVLDPIQADLGRDGKFTVSSSLIRELLRSGLVAQAAQCLARPHTITGIVARGSGRGRTLGFPTANLEQIAQLTPAEGVYAGRAWLADQPYLSAISVGTAITFDHGERLIEAVLLGLDTDIYDQQIRLEFHLHLRQQFRFASPQELAAQIKADCETVKTHFKKNLTDLPPMEPSK